MTESEMRFPPFLGADDAEHDFERARVAVLPVPYEKTVCWMPGTARGPEAILRASPHLEFHDEQMGIEPRRCGIWTAAPLDLGSRAPEDAAPLIGRRVGELMDAGKWVVMLGGEHSITPGAVQAAAERHPGLHVVQLDAHADMRESFAGDRFSHACAMRNCLPYAPVRGIGIRSYTAEESECITVGELPYQAIHSWEMGGGDWIPRALDGLDDVPVYLTFDVDYFDPSLMPATGTPEPGGGRWWPTLAFLERLFDRARVVACDVVELAPFPGLHHADFTVARLIHKMIGILDGGRSRAIPGQT